MAGYIELAIPGLDDLSKYLKTAKQSVRRHLNIALMKSGAIAERNAKQEAPVDTGALRSGIYLRVTDNQAIVAPIAKYAYDVEYGRSPGRLSGEERTSLRAWAKRKGLDPSAVVDSVESKGITQNPFMQRAADNSASAVSDAFEVAVNRIVEGW